MRRIESRYRNVVAESALAYGGQARTPSAVAEIMRPLIGDAPTEEFWLLTLDAKHRIVGSGLISRGTLTASLVHPREVFGPALRLAAAAIIVCHNHPSGDPEPSSEDLAVTRRLHEIGDLHGVPLFDHVIVTHLGHVSLRERMNL